jgi:isoquinoline 1-oxidoreductase beta subunit
MSKSIRLDRRQFIVGLAAGGGLALGCGLPRGNDSARAEAGATVGIWAVIYPDDTTVVRIARSEMGQGTRTGLAQLVADELDADWSKVRTEYVAPEVNLAHERAWGDMSTGGSRGIRGSVDYVRRGGAVARAMLLGAAAERWGVPVGECSAANSVITHTPSGRTLRYGEVASDAAARAVPAEVMLKQPGEWKLIGKSVKRLDTADKLNGKLTFAIDVRLPGMLNASIAQCPVFGGKLKSFDAPAIASMPGVHTAVPVGDDAVAVVADTFWQAKSALAKLPIVWDEGANATASSATIAANLKTGLDAPEAGLGQKHGDAASALDSAAKRVEAVYGTPFVSHATMEPMNCTARVDGGSVEIWVPTQNGEAALRTAANTAGVKEENVKVHKHDLGGGFGRRGQQDYVRQAVLIAKQVPGRPVKLIWTREEDIQHDFYRPIAQCKLTGGLDGEGNLSSLAVRISAQSIAAYLAPSRMQNGVDSIGLQGLTKSEFGYMAIPNLTIEYAMRNSHVPVGFWRGVNVNQNAIFTECFIDECAHAAGKDPLEFRRSLLTKSPKHLAVLNTVADKAGWSTPAPVGVARGVAQFCGYNSYVAAVAEVSVSDEGKLKIHRIVCAIDPGHAVNPAQIAAQTEGSFVYGLSALLYSEITIQNGRVAQGNFDTYPVMRLNDMPKVEVVVMPSGGFWGGVGEPTIAVAAPAVLNAIFAATGKRIRSTPLARQDLRRA